LGACFTILPASGAGSKLEHAWDLLFLDALIQAENYCCVKKSVSIIPMQNYGTYGSRNQHSSYYEERKSLNPDEMVQVGVTEVIEHHPPCYLAHNYSGGYENGTSCKQSCQ
jgi:hypothetical protein